MGEQPQRTDDGSSDGEGCGEEENASDPELDARIRAKSGFLLDLDFLNRRLPEEQRIEVRLLPESCLYVNTYPLAAVMFQALTSALHGSLLPCAAPAAHTRAMRAARGCPGTEQYGGLGAAGESGQSGGFVACRCRMLQQGGSSSDGGQITRTLRTL